MDNTSSNVIGVIGFVLTIGGGIYTAINHKRIRSKCCGKNMDASFDVDNTSPTLPVSTKPPSIAPIQ